MTLRLLCAVLCLCPPSLGYKHYQQQIPNGDIVPDPSLPTAAVWQGVGHNNAQGGGSRNIFGQDFAANAHKWDEQLCRRDSDSDGLTNGEELGDPDCVWSPGDQPHTTEDLSHPGICEPLDTDHCQKINEDVDLDSGTPFNCPATEEPDVTATIYRFPPTDVPAKETNYFCLYFPLLVAAGTSEHVVAYEPIIDNAEVMHHTVVYGCRSHQSAAVEATYNGSAPFDCQGSMRSCQEVMVLWTVGLKGTCYPDEFGALIGEGGYTGIWMEHHWNNPVEKTGLVDSSGMKLYHTPSKRDYNGAYLVYGAQTIELPASEENVLQTGGCHPECTKLFGRDSIFISQIIPHMHIYGRVLSVTLNDEFVMTERHYDYNAPSITTFDPPIEMKRGDHLKVNCTYSTGAATQRTYFGESTQDEMCFAMALAYPVDESIVSVCQDADGYGYCHHGDGGGFYGDWGDCDIEDFFSSANWTEMSLILEPACDADGMVCREGCPDAVREVEDRNPCLAGDTGRSVRGFMELQPASRPLMNMLISCHEVIYDPSSGYGCLLPTSSVLLALLSIAIHLAVAV